MAEPPGTLRAESSSAATALAGTVLVLALVVAVCLGMGGVAFAGLLREQAAQLRSRSRAQRETMAMHAEADRLMGEMRDRLVAMHAARREFPSALPEAPPEDPWGLPLRYERTGPDRAWLTSAGPDGEFGTGDDIGGEVAPE